MPQDKDSVFTEPKNLYGQKIKSEPVPEKQIGVDTDQSIFQDLIDASISNQLDISAFTNFDQASRSRDEVYNLMDTMCQDSTIASVLETYAEDSVERNDAGRIVWADSSDSDIGKYVNYLLDSMRVDKNVYKWVQSLCKYGDLYLRIYRESEYDDGLFDKSTDCSNKKLNEDIDLSSPDIDIPREKLEEQVNIKAFSKNDHFVQYLEMQANPAQVFELTRFGKTYAYIQTHVDSTGATNSGSTWNTANSNLLGYRYNFNRGDIDIYSATDFVHGCLEDSVTRTPEEVTISLNTDKSVSYQVRRGTPLFYSAFKAWRELLLLKNSVLLNRVTRSSLVRAIQVEVGDMPKEQVQPHLQGIKRLFEQSQALVAGQSMSEYTNPGPIENNIYIPTRDGKGALNVQQVGGDVNVGQLADLDYHTDVLFGALGAPKQYFSHTDDSAGFSGGESLAQISSRYAKRVKRIQSTLIQMLTDAINILLLDRNLGNYINKFTLKMQAPMTSEEVAKRDSMSSRIQLTSDVMNVLSDVSDPVIKLKILKSLLAEYLNNPEVVELLQQEINQLESSESAQPEKSSETSEQFDLDSPLEDAISARGSFNPESSEEAEFLQEPEAEESEVEEVGEPDEEQPSDQVLPSPDTFGIDFTDSSNF